MTDDIARLRALEAAATKGSWKFVPWHIEEANAAVRAPTGWLICSTSSDADSELIAEMRNALPALLDRLEKAEGELAEAREDVRSLCRFILNEWGPDGALKATTFALEQRQSAKGGSTMTDVVDLAADLLFPPEGRRVGNVKFFLGSRRDVTADELASEVMSAQQQIADGRANRIIAAEAKAVGYDPKLIRRRVRENLMSEADKAKRDREEAEYEAMCRVLGL